MVRRTSPPPADVSDCTASIGPMGRTDRDLTFSSAETAYRRAGLDWDGDGPDPADDLTRLLLSDQCPFTLTAAAFGDDSRTTLLDRVELEGSVLRQYDGALAFVAAHAGEGRGWPMDAVREALANALQHRDYGMPGPTTLAMMPDRLQIVSLGGLPQGLTAKDLSNQPHAPRNPGLAEAFRRLGLAAGCASGIPRIVAAYRPYAQPARIGVGPGTVSLTMPRPRPLAEAGDDGGHGAVHARAVSDAHPNVYAFPLAPPTDLSSGDGQVQEQSSPESTIVLSGLDWHTAMLCIDRGRPLTQTGDEGTDGMTHALVPSDMDGADVDGRATVVDCALTPDFLDRGPAGESGRGCSVVIRFRG